VPRPRRHSIGRPHRAHRDGKIFVSEITEWCEFAPAKAAPPRSKTVTPCHQSGDINDDLQRHLERDQRKGSKVRRRALYDMRGKMQHVTFDIDLVDEDFLTDGTMFDGSSIAAGRRSTIPT